MAISEEVVATTKVFDRGKTTLPSEIRRALGVVDGDKVAWIKDSSDRYYVENARKRGVRYPKPG